MRESADPCAAGFRPAISSPVPITDIAEGPSLDQEQTSKVAREVTHISQMQLGDELLTEAVDPLTTSLRRIIPMSRHRDPRRPWLVHHRV